MFKNIRYSILVTLGLALLFAIPSLADFKNDKPSTACKYLAYIGLNAGDYQILEEGYDNYFCCSSYKEVGGPGWPVKNDISYYVEGSADSIRTLYLVLSVNNKTEAGSAHSSLVEYGNHLTQKALGQSLPKGTQEAIMKGKPGEWTLSGSKIKVSRDDWPTGKGYSIKLSIE